MPGIMGRTFTTSVSRHRKSRLHDLGTLACTIDRRSQCRRERRRGDRRDVGPFFGQGWTKGGLGAVRRALGPWTVGAIVVTNCVGNVYDPFQNQTIGGLGTG